MGFGSLPRDDRLKIENDIKVMTENGVFDSPSLTSTTLQYLTSAALESSTSTTSKPSTLSIIMKPQSSTKSNLIQGFLGSIGKQSSNKQFNSDELSLNDQIIEYRALATKEYSNIVENGKIPDAVEFWYHNARHLKKLYKLANKYLTTPATSVPSEHAFSVASYIGRKQRARLTPENLSMSVFLKDKLNTVDEDI